MPADYTQCRVRKQSNECESEKRLVKSQRSGVALTEYGARGALAGRALPTSTACGRKTVLPPRDYINSFAFTIRSPSHFVRLHGKPHRLLFRAGAQMEPHQFGQIFCARDRASEASFTLFFYLPPSVGLLLTILGKIFCTRLRSRMRCIFRPFLLSTAERQFTADRVDRFSVRAIAHVRHLLFFFNLPPSVGSLEQSLECDPDFFCPHCFRASINPFAFRKIM